MKKMRKRQWKKVLSLVLALAMVFTMNTGAFADTISGGSAPVEAEVEQEPAPVQDADIQEQDPAEASQDAVKQDPEEPSQNAENTENTEPASGVSEESVPDADAVSDAVIPEEAAGETPEEGLTPQDSGSVDGKNIYFEWPEDFSNYITVSGMKISPHEGKTASGSIISYDGIYKVTVSEGTVLVGYDVEDDIREVDFCVPENSTVVFDNTGKHSMALEGSGTVLFKQGVAGSEFTLKENTLSLSANEPQDGEKNSGLLISENAGRYHSSVYGSDEAVTGLSLGTGIKVYVAAENNDTLVQDTGNNTFIPMGDLMDYYVVNDGMSGPEKLEVGKAIDLTKTTESDPVHYGATVFCASDPDFSGAVKYTRIKERYVNNAGNLTFFDSNIGPDRAVFKAPKGFDEGKTLYAISTDATEPGPDKFVDFRNASKVPDDDPRFVLNSDHMIGGSPVKGETLYYVFCVSGDDMGEKYFSSAKRVGSFKTKKEQKLAAASNNGTIYYGGQDSLKHDAVAAGIISFAMGDTGYTVKEERNNGRDRITVFDPNDSNHRVGCINVYVFKPGVWSTGMDTNFANAINGDFQGYIESLVGDKAPAFFSNGWEEDGQRLTDMVSDNGYTVKAVFIPEAGSPYPQLSANTITINVSPAPVKVTPQPRKAPINRILNYNVELDGTGTPLRFTNKITGEDIECAEEYFNVHELLFRIGNDPVFIPESRVSFNSAGIKEFSISPNTVFPAGRERGDAIYVVDSLEKGKLSVFGEVTPDDFVMNTANVYYGEDLNSIKKNFTVSYNNGTGVLRGVKNNDYKVTLYKKDAISPDGKKISENPEALRIDDIQKQDAGTEFYVQVLVDKSKIDTAETGTTSYEVVSKLVTLKKRPVRIYVNGNESGYESTAKPFGTKRNILPENTPAGGKAKATVIPVEDHPYSSQAPAIAQSLNKDAVYDMGYVDITVASANLVPLNDVVLNDPKNFEVQKACGWFIVEPAYYAYFTLEYGGQNVKAGNKTVYMADVIYPAGDAEKITWRLPKELQNSTDFNGAIGEGRDMVDHYIAYRANDTEKVPRFGGRKNEKDDVEFSVAELSKGVDFAPGDLYFQAIVKAYTTENVYIESIPAVKYDGNKHAPNVDGYKDASSQKKDIELKIFDEVRDRELVYGTDYTLTVKNNVNASVAYDKSSSASSNLSDTGAITQLFKGKNRPLISIKGKNDYKGLATTVYFDILPRSLDETVDGYIETDASNLKALSDNRYNFLKLKKGQKMNSYKFKIVDHQILMQKNGGVWGLTKEKKLTLKSSQYEELLIRTNNVYPTADISTYKVLASGKDIKKTVPEPGEGYAIMIKGKGNYFGSVVYPLTLVDYNVKLLSELKWKAKNVKFRPEGVSSDAVTGNFNVRAGTKLDKKKLTYGTDFTAVISTKSDSAAMGDGVKVRKDLAATPGTYNIRIVPGPSIKTAEAEGKIFIDDFTIDGTVKGAKLSKSYLQIKTEPSKPEFSGKEINNIRIEKKGSGKYKEGEDYIALPGTIYLDEPLFNFVKAKALLGERAEYIDENGWLKYGTTTAMAYPEKGRQINEHKWEYAFNASSAAERMDNNKNYGNSRPGTYEVPVIGRGNYAGSILLLSYEVKGIKLTKSVLQKAISYDACYVNVNGSETKFYLSLPDGHEVKVAYNDEDPSRTGKTVHAVTQYDYAVYKGPDHPENERFFTLTYNNGNKKTGDGKVKISPSSRTGYYFTGSSAPTAKFRIDTRKVKGEMIHSLYDYDALVAANGGNPGKYAGDLFVVADDRYVKIGKTTVRIYQATEEGKLGEKLGTSDFGFGEVSSGGKNFIELYDGKNKNFSFENAPIRVPEAEFDIYSKKASNWKLVFDDKAAYVSENGETAYRPFTLNNNGSTGIVVFNGKALEPQIKSLTVEGVDLIVNGKPVENAGASYEVGYENNINVGSAAYVTVRLKKDGKGKYDFGGLRKFKFKINPQPSNSLVLGW
ncbi:MAG: hypothetical protein K6F86_07745 [Lachnospiraceae bacterium]|nr:hypothetical protein [Lachnospiraceae bacterium]